MAEPSTLKATQIVPVDIGHTDTDHTTCLHVPSIGLVVAGDAIYNGTHPYLVESDRQGLNDWLAAIDKIEALNPRAVVVGHGPLDPDNSPRHIQETRRYIQDFIRLNGRNGDRPRTLRSDARPLSRPHQSRITLGQRERRQGFRAGKGLILITREKPCPIGGFYVVSALDAQFYAFSRSLRRCAGCIGGK